MVYLIPLIVCSFWGEGLGAKCKWTLFLSFVGNIFFEFVSVYGVQFSNEKEFIRELL